MSHATLGLVLTYQPDHAAIPTHGFSMGAPILTLDGILPVEYLSPGDRIVTRNGARRLATVEVTLLRHARVVLLGPDSLGAGRPTAPLIVTADQPILIRDWRARALYGTASALIPAARLADGEFIRAETLPELRLYTLTFAEPEVIYAGDVELACPALIPA